MSDEMLTIEEIEARYAPFWVLIADPQVEEGPRLLGGRVVSTSTESDELYRKAAELGLKQVAVRYLGSYPEHMAINIGLFF